MWGLTNHKHVNNARRSTAEHSWWRRREKRWPATKAFTLQHLHQPHGILGIRQVIFTQILVQRIRDANRLHGEISFRSRVPWRPLRLHNQKSFENTFLGPKQTIFNCFLSLLLGRKNKSRKIVFQAMSEVSQELEWAVNSCSGLIRQRWTPERLWTSGKSDQ